jgi:hypothetical protein
MPKIIKLIQHGIQNMEHSEKYLYQQLDRELWINPLYALAFKPQIVQKSYLLMASILRFWKVLNSKTCSNIIYFLDIPIVSFLANLKTFYKSMKFSYFPWYLYTQNFSLGALPLFDLKAAFFTMVFLSSKLPHFFVATS